jgi:hypothetical protein
MDNLRRWVQWVEWALVAALAVVAAVRTTVDPAQLGDTLWMHIVQGLRNNYVAVVMTLAVGIFGSKIAQSVLERWTTSHKGIKAVLDSAHKIYFQDVAKSNPQELYQHRVTLFRARRHLRDLLLNPANAVTSGWPRALGVYCRSGTAYQRSRTRLRIDDENEAANEGVAGRAWFTNAAWTVSDLPEWPDRCTNPAVEPNCSDYAEKGFMSVPKADSVAVKSRSLSAHVVRTKTGQKWGVLVFDSRHPQGVADLPERKHIIELSAHLLSQLL